MAPKVVFMRLKMLIWGFLSRWTGISTSTREDGNEAEPLEQFAVREMGLAGKVAGVSGEYVSWAMRFVAMEAARDLGWVAGTRTAAEVVGAVKKRFPVLEDIQKAYCEGSKACRKERGKEEYEEPPAGAGARSGDGRVSSDSGGSAGAGDEDRTPRKAKTVFGPEVHGDVEMVPVLSMVSSGECDQGKEQGSENTAKRENHAGLEKTANSHYFSDVEL